MNTGYIRGFKQILVDMDLSETEFTAKYFKTIDSLKLVFETSANNHNADKNINELSGYNNAILDVLCLLNEKNLYYNND